MLINVSRHFALNKWLCSLFGKFLLRKIVLDWPEFKFHSPFWTFQDPNLITGYSGAKPVLQESYKWMLKLSPLNWKQQTSCGLLLHWWIKSEPSDLFYTSSLACSKTASVNWAMHLLQFRKQLIWNSLTKILSKSVLWSCLSGSPQTSSYSVTYKLTL